MKNKISIFSVCIFLSVSMLLISCREQKAGWQGTFEEENGITVVKNPEAPIYSEDMFSFDGSGNLIKRIERDYTPLEVTQREVDERMADYTPERKKNLYIPKHFPPFRWMISDDEGRIYVWTYERTPDWEGFYYDIFDAEGKYILKVPFKSRPLVIKKNKFYTIEEDEDGFQYVKRYRMNWNLK